MKSLQIGLFLSCSFSFGVLTGCGSAGVNSSSSTSSTSFRDAAGACQGINLPGRYVAITNCRFGQDYLGPGAAIQLTVQGDSNQCSFAASTSVTDRNVEYSITPPPGVIVGPYDMCALWAFDEGSRPGSFPAAMREPCRIWMNRPPDRVKETVREVKQDFSPSQIRLDIARRVSNIGDCAVRR